eukprot:TRINITY_DN3116_c0_g2_i1.p1 TRINITY_DN3116_c0_g2~~TRINITY_DN3116_c0_g2_i1.p1  ORF type:complete len:216 (+),score=54.59 TRINITY_DN3116_c0_g2_i1:38-685(+)
MTKDIVENTNTDEVDQVYLSDDEILQRVLELSQYFEPYYPKFNYPRHDSAHFEHVAFYAAKVAQTIGLEVDHAIIGGLLHDLGRDRFEIDNKAHGPRGSEYCKKMVTAGVFDIFENLPVSDVIDAIRLHTSVTRAPATNLISVCVCDGDRLSLARFGANILPQYLSSEMGFLIAKRLNRGNIRPKFRPVVPTVNRNALKPTTMNHSYFERWKNNK